MKSKIAKLCLLRAPLLNFGQAASLACLACGAEGSLAEGSPESAFVAQKATPTRAILTGIPNYSGNYGSEITNTWGDEVLPGCGPVAGLMLLAYYDRRYGYSKLVPTSQEDDDLPENLIWDLREEMGTITIPGDNAGMTLPDGFESGLENYVDARYSADVRKTSASTEETIAELFENSIRLINAQTPQAILYYRAEGFHLFPDHYAVVVGYSREDGKRELIINPGYGYDFKILDLNDSDILPITTYWLGMNESPNASEDGHRIGPGEPYDWVNLGGVLHLAPDVFKHAESRLVSWRASDKTTFAVKGSDIALSKWWD